MLQNLTCMFRYAKVLRGNPECPPEVRLGIAACYYRAGKLEAATTAYNRVLELDAGNADALLGLAIVKFGSNNVQEVGLVVPWRCKLLAMWLFRQPVPGS